MRPYYINMVLLAMVLLFSCNSPQEHTAPAIYEKDSVAMMTSYGINTMISDSGVMKYRIIAERWEVNDKKNPKLWYFERGLFLEQFDEKFHVESYIQCDTAYNYYEKKLWHLVGNVRVRTVDGVDFSSEELYWDQYSHEMYSNKFSRVVSPVREMQGTKFRSDEYMTHYYVSNGKGAFDKSDFSGEDEQSKQPDNQPADQMSPPRRQLASPVAKSN